MDGIDPDNPANQKSAERRPVSWKARQLVADYAELGSMSEADLKRYCGGA
jgi:hypothetical protein